MKARLVDRWRAVIRGARQLLGAPDYDRYLEHMAAHHPDTAPLSRRKYCARAVDHRYGTQGPRCC